MHKIGDPTSACPHCGAPRVWKCAKTDGPHSDVMLLVEALGAVKIARAA